MHRRGYARRIILHRMHHRKLPRTIPMYAMVAVYRKRSSFQELGVKHPDDKKCCFTCRGRPIMDEICDNLDKATLLVQRSRFKDNFI
jgi:hypothetical protein